MGPMNMTTGKIGARGYAFIGVLSLLLTLVVASTLLQAVVGAALILALVWLSDIDIATRRLPNKIVGALAVCGLVAVGASHVANAFGYPVAAPVAPVFVSPGFDALTGSALASLPPLALAILYRLFRGRPGFGAGDIKLLAVLGMYLGLYAVFILPMAALLSLAFIGARKVFTPTEVHLDTTFPFGPFIAAASILMIVWGGTIWSVVAGLLLP